MEFCVSSTLKYKEISPCSVQYAVPKKKDTWWNRSFEATVTFLPPLAVSLIYPDLFLVALDIVGGVGITLVFGILPTLILLRTKGGLFSFKKFLGIVMLIAFIGLFALELSQEMPRVSISLLPYLI